MQGRPMVLNGDEENQHETATATNLTVVTFFVGLQTQE